MNDEIISINKMYKIYSGIVDTVAVENFSMSTDKGEVIAITGPSGSGKSTIIQCLGGVLRVSSGEILVNNEDITNYDNKQLVAFRRDTVGLVYQDFNLLDEFTIFENIAIPLIIANKSKSEIETRVNDLLKQLSISRYSKTFPRFISGGEKQRVAIAVALANDPDIILADEPTGNLDEKNSDLVIDLLFDQVRSRNKSLVIATHDQSVWAKVDRVINLRNNNTDE